MVFKRRELCFSACPRLVFVLRRVFAASCLYSGALSWLFSSASSCFFLVFMVFPWKTNPETF